MKRNIKLVISLIIVGITIIFIGGKTEAGQCYHPLSYRNYVYEDGMWHKEVCKSCGYVVTKSKHNVGDWQTDTQNTKHWRVCKDCKSNIDEATHITSLDELSDSSLVVWNSSTDGHWKVCGICKKKYGEGKHNILGVDWTPSKSNNTQHVKLCTTCGYEVEKANCNDWWLTKISDKQHAEVCHGCSRQKNVTDHTIEIVDKTIESHTLKCTVCKDTIAVVPHDENNLIWEEYGNGHRQKCKDCGKVITIEPIHQWEEKYRNGEETHWLKCSKCDKTTKESAHTLGEWQEFNSNEGHCRCCEVCDMSFNVGPHSDANNDGVCDICGLPINNNRDVSTATYVAEHCNKGCKTWDFTYGTAYECYATCEGGHTKWSVGKHSGTPTCTEKKTCTICGYMYWLEHDYVNGECTMCHAKEPTEPTATPTPTPIPTSGPTPTIVPTTTSTAAPSPTVTPTPTGNWQKDVYYHWQVGGEKELHKPIPATCTEPISCVCGATIGKAKGHRYNDNGVCTVCGVVRANEFESTSTSEAKSVPFKDVNPGDWYYDNGCIKYVTDKGYIQGLSSSEFGPDKDMTRGDFIKMLYIITGRPSVIIGYTSEDQNITAIYSDIKGDTDTINAIIWGRKNNIMNGMNDGRFGVEEGLSRQQMAVALKKYAEIIRKENTSARDNLDKYVDSVEVFNWAEDAVKWAVARKIISGSGNRLYPQANATRAQVATMIMNYLTK